MGEARRKKIAGYIPEPKKEYKKPKKIIVGSSGMGHMAMIAALMADYPKLPRNL